MNKKNDLVRVEGSTELATTPKKISIVGLEEVPPDIIPVPFYRIVYPGKVTLANGSEAEAGTFFMGDTGKTTKTLELALLRAKRKKVEFEEGKPAAVRLQILGMNLERFTPFILSLSPTSFTTFGRLVRQLIESKTKIAWQYKITATTEKTVNEKKQIYWIVNFELGEKLDKETIGLLEDAYQDYAASLDWRQEDDDEEIVMQTST